jgi:mono/diheme cytochrome c family protein
VDAVANDTQAKVTPADDAQVRNGATLFNAACASCHATHAPMTTFGGRPSLALSTSVNARDPRNTLRLILDGIPAGRGTRGPMMPAFSNTLADSQIADIAKYLRAHFSSQSAWTLNEADVTKLRKETSEP